MTTLKAVAVVALAVGATVATYETNRDRLWAPAPSYAVSPVSSPFDMEQDVTVSGCLERDAAASSVVYKLVAKDASGDPKIYRLSAPDSIDLKAHLGHTIELTGTVTTASRNGRDELSMAIKSLKMVSSSCPKDPS
jgi:hypothetical protein